MLTILLLLSVAFLLTAPDATHSQASGAESESESDALRVMTWNVRCANAGDAAQGHGWPDRLPLVLAQVQQHTPDLLCVQEALDSQMDDLRAALPDYESFGVGREDGLEKGEYAAVFYRRARFERLHGETIWLSPTPDRPGKGWDAALERIATRVRLREKKGARRSFELWNTHFDHQGQRARLESARLLKSRIESADLPTVLVGDFNAVAATPEYRELTSNATLRDARAISEAPPSGAPGSFVGWSQPLHALGWIDHIFVTAGLRVTRIEVPTSGFERTPHPSDHLPIVADLLLLPRHRETR